MNDELLYWPSLNFEDKVKMALRTLNIRLLRTTEDKVLIITGKGHPDAPITTYKAILDIPWQSFKDMRNGGKDDQELLVSWIEAEYNRSLDET